MIRSFLVLALPLAISAASSNAVAGFDVDDVDFKAKDIESINQFQGNRRKMLNNAFRDLEVSQTCKDETNALQDSGSLPDFSVKLFDPEFTGKHCDLEGSEYTCNLKNQFSGVKDACKKENGQLLRLRITSSQSILGQTASWNYENMSACIGASCVSDEYISSMEDGLNAIGPFIPGDVTVTVEYRSDYYTSGAQSTRMHYGAAVASALAMAGVTFLN